MNNSELPKKGETIHNVHNGDTAEVTKVGYSDGEYWIGFRYPEPITAPNGMQIDTGCVRASKFEHYGWRTEEEEFS